MTLIDGKSELPVGLGMRLALDLKAMTNFANLPEHKKKELVNYIKESSSGYEAENRITEVVSSLRNGDTFR